MDETPEWTPYSEQGSMPTEPPQQTIALRDLELPRWRPADTNDTSPSNEMQQDDNANTSLEQSGVASRTTYTSDIDTDSASSVSEETCDGDIETPLEYARRHGMSRDHEMDDPLVSAVRSLCLTKTENATRREWRDATRVDWEDPPGLPSVDAHKLLAEVNESVEHERWNIDKETADYMVSLYNSQQQPGNMDLGDGSVFRLEKKLKDLGLWPPVLPYDHEQEMLAIRARSMTFRSVRDIKPFQLDVEKGESMKISQAEIRQKSRVEEEIENEKLGIGKDTVNFMRELKAISAGVGGDDSSVTDEAYRDYRASPHAFYYFQPKADDEQRAKALRPSPPLLPETPPYSTPPSAPEAMEIEMTSTPEDLIAKDAAALEKELLQEDELIPATPTHGPVLGSREDAAAIEAYTVIPASSSPLKRKRVRSLRVEPPLTPQYHADTTSDDGPEIKKIKRVQFDPALVALLPSPDQNAAGMLVELADEQGDALLQQSIKAAAESVEKDLQNEQLVEIDTTLRVQAPEPKPAKPTWEEYAKVTDAADPTRTKRAKMSPTTMELIKYVNKWGGAKKIERSLPWAPFPSHMAKVDLNEEFDDGYAARYLADNDLGSNKKPETKADKVVPRLGQFCRHWINEDEEVHPVMFSDDDEYDEEFLGPPPVIEENGEDDVEEDDSEVQELAGAEVQKVVPSTGMTDMLELLRRKQLDLSKDNGQQLAMANAKVPATSLLTSGPFANTMQGDGISQFMQLHGKAQSLSDVPGHAIKTPAEVNSAKAVQNTAPAAVMMPQTAVSAAQTQPSVPIPVPELHPDKLATIPVIASTTFLSNRNRQFTHRLTAVLPTIEFVERDAEVVGLHQYDKITEDDADITISPSTGVITTTLQKLKQRPLPGQTSFFGVRDRISLVSVRYERLIVLVNGSHSASTGEDDSVRPLDQLDCDALVDLIGWVASLECEVQIKYVAGDKNEMADWLAATIVYHSVTDASSKVLQDETMWERWLRKASMNAFAAQAILGELKARDPDHREESRSSSADTHLSTNGLSGLTAFVAMSEEQRVERFSAKLGGESVLRRVSKAIDGGFVVR